MQELRLLFPPNDFVLLMVIIGLPLLGAIANGVFGKRVGKEAVTLMALTSVGISFLASVVAFAMLYDVQQGSEKAVRFVWHGWRWVNASGRLDSGPIPIEIAFSYDALSAVMALVVTGVGFLIHLYSTKYMAKDPGYHRFFSYMNLFIFSMLVLILGDNLPVLFVGWEGVGLCSYLLIGFWFEDGKNATAGKKAFIANRIGDFGLIVAMAMLIYYVGALDWTGIEGGRASLLDTEKVWPLGLIGQFLPESWWIATPVHVSRATLVGLALFLGCVGKSAQIPLYVWLPDAMAGPTPVSALIHAATMVTAGVYLVCRMAGVFILSPAVMLTVALVGAVTAVFAATIAVTQHDIKKVLAYSTVSQLGYMFLGVGVGAFAAGFFHVVTHAFFKACLFLGAGSVIYAMHRRIHATDASQDMRNMGGLRRFMPVTFATFVAAWAAISGLPGTSGFFSKDEILHKAFVSAIASPTASGRIGAGVDETTLFAWPDWAPPLLYALGVIGAVMTAFYMSRLVIGMFFGDFRGWQVVKRHEATRAHDEHHHAPEEGPIEGPQPVESPWQMTAPLVILGVLALFAGLLNAHLLHLTWFEQWLNPVFARAGAGVTELERAATAGPIVLSLALAAFGAGAGAAYWVYLSRRGEPAQNLRERFPGLYALVYDKWRVDEFYDESIVWVTNAAADVSTWFDKWVVDGIVSRLTSGLVALAGAALRYVQVGRVQGYAATMMVGVVSIGWFVSTPQTAATTTSDHEAGRYVIAAAPGLGYRYRWDTLGDGSWDSEEFGDQRTTNFELKVDETRTVRLEVMNAFGRVGSEEYVLHRPKPDRSRGPTIIELGRDPSGALRGVPRPPRGAMPAPGRAPGQGGTP